MDTFQINKQLQHLKCFKGTYPKDLLPIKYYKQRPIAIVINTDTSDKKGQHWVALVLNKTSAEYLDSYGFKPICCEIKKLLKINKIKLLKYNKYHLQSITSSVCGKYCILFIKMKCNNFTLNNFLSLFSTNKIKNDFLVQKYLLLTKMRKILN